MFTVRLGRDWNGPPIPLFDVPPLVLPTVYDNGRSVRPRRARCASYLPRLLGEETMTATSARYTDPLEAMDAGHRWCYAIPSNAVFHAGYGFVPSLVVEDVAGHFPMLGNGVGATPWYWGMTREEAERTCEHANAKRGISADMAREIVSRSAIAPTRGNRRKVPT